MDGRELIREIVAMGLFGKKWKAPDPHLVMVVALANEELPSLLMLANPAAADGAVEGMAGPANEKPSAENMVVPMREGDYAAISPGGGVCGIRVERPAAGEEPLSLGDGELEMSGLTEETLAKFNRPVWRAIVQMETPGNDVWQTVVFATRVAQRLASLADGVVMDTSAYRFFGPGGWPVEEPNPEFDVREHVHIHIINDIGWLHTHGLIKFGRPEIEIYDVPPDLEIAAFATLLDISQYVITSAMIEPGQTCGEPSQPFYAREGKKNQKEHWDGISVLELVDVDEHAKPVASGAPKALQLFAER